MPTGQVASCARPWSTYSVAVARRALTARAALSATAGRSVSVLVGTVVTVVAALVPARRATKVLPVEALREATPGAGRPSRKRGVAGAVLLALGVTGVLTGLNSGAGGKAVLFGIVGVVVGVMTLLPFVVRPLAAAIGGPLRLRGVSGELAQQNAMRNPRRTSSTAAALMIGLTLVVSMGVFASSLKSSFGGILDDSTKAQLFLSTSSAQAEGFSPEVVRSVAKVRGVSTVSATSFGEARFGGSSSYFSSIDPATAERVLDLDVSAGSMRDLGKDGVLLKKKVAAAHGWKVGDTVPVEFAETGKHNLRVAGVFDRNGSFIDNDYVLSIAGQDAYTGHRLDASGLVLLDEGANKAEVQDRITAALSDHPDARVLDQKGFEKVASGFIDKMLTFVTVMLLLAVFIALLGIVNTLALSAMSGLASSACSGRSA